MHAIFGHNGLMALRHQQKEYRDLRNQVQELQRSPVCHGNPVALFRREPVIGQRLPQRPQHQGQGSEDLCAHRVEEGVPGALELGVGWLRPSPPRVPSGAQCHLMGSRPFGGCDQKEPMT